MRGIWLFVGLACGLGCDDAKDADGGATGEVAGGTDTGCEPGNSPPYAHITSHSDGDVVVEGETETFVGVVGDGDDDLSTLTVDWYLDGDLVCEDAPVDEGGETSCDVDMGAGTSIVRLEVSDPTGATDQDLVVLNLEETDTPLVEIVQPSAGEWYDSAGALTFEGLVWDAETAAGDLDVWWESDLDGRLDVSGEPGSDGHLIGYSDLSVGTHVITLYAVDEDGNIGYDSVIIEVGPPNTPPECAITAPDSGATMLVGDSLVLAGVATDVDEPNDGLSVLWTSDIQGDLGAEPPGTDGDVLHVEGGLSAGTHVVTLTVTDNAGARCTDAVVVLVQVEPVTDNPPVVVIVDPDGGDVFREGQTIDFEALAYDVEDTADALSIVWSSDVDGVLSTDVPDVGGSVGFSTDTLSPGTHIITVTVTDSDGHTTSDTITITIDENAPPTQPEVEIAPDPAYTDDDLYAVLTTDAVDPDGDVLSYTYTWSLDGVVYSVGASDTVPDVATVKGQTWRVEVVASDGVWESLPASDELVIQNTPPSVETVTITPGSPTADDTLTCGYAGFFDLDEDEDNSRTAWTINGVAAGSGESLSGGFGAGDSVTCTVTPNDSEHDGVPVSDTVVIGDSAPTLLGAVLTPDPAFTNDTMLCTPDGVADDYAYRWEVAGAAVGSVTGATLASSYFVKHQLIQCFITPSSGGLSGEEVESNVVEVQNSPPTAPVVTIEPAFPEGGDDLICRILTESTDADDDVIGYAFAWTVDGAVYAATETTTHSGDTISSAATADGESWVCTVTPNDGEVDGPSDSAGVTIEENCGPLGGDSTDGDVIVDAGATRSLDMDASAVVGDNPAGDATIAVADGSPFIAGDEVLVLTMSSPAAECGDTEAGYWEVHQLAAVDGGVLSLRDGLAYSFDTSGGAVHQVVRVPHLRNVVLGAGATLSTSAWNGNTGGVLIFRSRSVALGDGARVDMGASGHLGGVSGDVPADGPRGGGLWLDGGDGGDGGDACSGAGCVGGAGDAGVDGGGGGGAGGGNPAIADGGSCGGGGGGGLGSGAASGGGLGAYDGGAGGTGGGSGDAGGGGGACASTAQVVCPDGDGQRLLLGSGAPAGAAGGCVTSGGGLDGYSDCAGDGADGGAGGGVIVILTAELSGDVDAHFEVSGAAGGDGGVGQPGSAGTGGGGGGSGAEGAAGGTIVVIAENWASDADRITAGAAGGVGGDGGVGGAGGCAGDCGGAGGAGADGANGQAGAVFVFGSWYATATFDYTADPVNMIEFYGGEDCLIEL